MSHSFYYGVRRALGTQPLPRFPETLPAKAPAPVQAVAEALLDRWAGTSELHTPMGMRSGRAGGGGVGDL